MSGDGGLDGATAASDPNTVYAPLPWLGMSVTSSLWNTLIPA